MKLPLFLFSLALFLGLAFVPQYNRTAGSIDSKTLARIPVDSFVTVHISITGDLMCHTPQYDNSKNPDGTYDFNPSFSYIKPYLEKADLTMGNLELTFAGKGIPYAGYPTFNAPDSYADALKKAGFDFVVTANNHSMDTEEKGLLRTLEIVRHNGIGSTGTFNSQSDHDSVRVLNIKGIKLGILNYTYGTNGAYPAAGHKYMLNVIDTLAIQADILRARNQGAELVLVFFHYGKENISDPTEAQKDIVRKTQEYGADIIIGGHPHVISPVNYYKTHRGTLDTGISNQYHRYTDAGVIFNLTLKKNLRTQSYSKPQADFTPTWVYRAYDPRMHKHIVLPAELSLKDSVPFFIDANSRAKMKEAFEDTKAIMTKYTKEVQLRKM
jgi:2',3'-cyclic-nucleotide 2'-phosphodiesterase (5'-nucleotidase family)